MITVVMRPSASLSAVEATAPPVGTKLRRQPIRGATGTHTLASTVEATVLAIPLAPVTTEDWMSVAIETRVVGTTIAVAGGG